jgi:hypothetical protein
MSFMLDSDLVEALVLRALKLDVWHINCRTNFGSIEVKFDDDTMVIVLGDIDSKLGSLLTESEYEVLAKPQLCEYTITKQLGDKMNPDNYRAKSFKKFLKLYRKYERQKIKSEKD